MRMDDWHEATFWNSFECKTNGVDGGEATESSSDVKDSGAADANTEISTPLEPEDHTDINTSDSASKVKESFGDVKVGNTADIETDRDSSVHFQNPHRKRKKKPSGLLASHERKIAKRKDAEAPKKK